MSHSTTKAMEIQSPFYTNCMSGKVALITGGGSGICFGITKQFLLHGLDGAVICGRRKQFLERSSSILENETGKPCKYKVCDVRDSKACQEAVQYTINQFGRLDIVVNGAAGNFLAEARTLSPKGFATVLAIDTQGTFNMCRASYDTLSKNMNDTVIINISATLQCPATYWQIHSSAAKAAVDSITRTLALEWGSDKIRVVGIAPGPIADTPGMTKLAPGLLSSDDIGDMLNEGIPLGRLGLASEIGHAAIYLANATFVTGDVLIVDGGQWLYKPPLVPKEMVAELSRGVEAKSRAQAPTRSKL